MVDSATNKPATRCLHRLPSPAFLRRLFTAIDKAWPCQVAIVMITQSLLTKPARFRETGGKPRRDYDIICKGAMIMETLRLHSALPVPRISTLTARLRYWPLPQ
jgi:hypothetical protein